jgi:superfamily II DNA or RNA helicase
VRGERWVVVGLDRFESCTVLALEGGDRDNLGQRSQLIEPFDRFQHANPDRLRRRRRDSVLRGALAATAREKPVTGLWTAADARIALLPYQLEPALAALDGATRILLADDVGLGKTIQAGLILSELRARGLVDRALVLTPAGLRDTWAAELRDRFGVHAVILDQPAIAERTAFLPAEINPWTLKGVTITSLDLAKRAEILASIEEAPFDLVIADEAHHLTPGSDRGAAVARLASRVPWVILVSATPHSGDDAAFNYLLGLGALGDRLTVFRRSRGDVGSAGRRRTHLLAVRPMAAEEEMLRGAERYARAIWQARGTTEPVVQLVAMTLARRAASSATALCRTLTRRLALMSGGPDPSPRQPPLPWEDIDGGDDDAAWLGCAGLDDALEERRQLEALIVLARNAELRGSKTYRLLRFLERAREPAVVFTEYRDTLDALQRTLESFWPVAVIHGGLGPPVRQQAIERFRRGDANVLIATDAAGEGLNLHHRCRLVINIELPWNPLRLEQRVGRVDRIGQSRRVHAVHLIHRRSIEETVLARLERRRLSAERGLRDASAWLSENDIAQTVLGECAVPARAAPQIATAHVARAVAERSRVEEQRRLRARLRNGVAANVCWAPPRRRSPGRHRMILLHLVQHLDADSRVSAEHYVPLAVELSVIPRDRREWRLVIAAMARDTGVRNACVVESEVLAAAAAREKLPLALAVTSRIERIRARLAQGPKALRQVSLFDRRSEREAETLRHVRATLDAHFERRADQLSGKARVAIRLIAAWAADEADCARPESER